jgi:hypothetical protein
MRRQGIHAPRQVTPRLQAILTVLREAGQAGITGYDLTRKAQITGLEGVRELRHLGYTITCEKERTTVTGRKVYRYTLHE